jgi:hypothetical protein
MPRVQGDELPKRRQFTSLSLQTSDLWLWQACHPMAPGEAVAFAKIENAPADVGLVLQVAGSGLKLINSKALGGYVREGSWAIGQKDGLEARWASIQLDPTYQWLSKREGWSSAFASLHLMAKRKAASKYAHPLARFRLVSVIALNVGWYLIARRDGREPSTLNKVEARKGLLHVRALSRFLERDLELIAIVDKLALAQALGSLKIVLESAVAPGRYKERSDGTLLERRFIKRVVEHLNEAFGGISPVLAGHIASIAGYVVPDTTLQRIIDDAKKGASDEKSV